MKKTIRSTAAAMAAIIAMSCVSFAALADDSYESIDGGAGYVETLSGGWQISGGSNAMNKNPEANAAFKKATADLDGVSYKAIAVLGTQVVAGTNYAILCKATPIYPDAASEVRIMYIYEDLTGSAEITGFQTIIGEMLDGGFAANSGKFSLSKNKGVYAAYRQAMDGLTGVSYEPIAYLGSQVVAGSNYLILCRSRVVYPNAPYGWSLVTVNKALDGTVSLVDINTLELGNTDNTAAVGDNTGVQIPNPWQEYKTVSEAANAAGISFNAPNKLGKHKLSHIQAADGIVEVSYTKNGNEISIRKGAGTDDISGDFETYKNVTEKMINGCNVTLKGNGEGIISAVWTDGECSYSIYSENELTEKFVKSIIAKTGK
ncbi:MAG: DUF4367 domain-containing protein [Oscillospiraceae bacterium]